MANVSLLKLSSPGAAFSRERDDGPTLASTLAVIGKYVLG